MCPAHKQTVFGTRSFAAEPVVRHVFENDQINRLEFMLPAPFLVGETSRRLDDEVGGFFNPLVLTAVGRHG